MSGPIIKAGKVSSEYGSKYASKSKGNIVLKNSGGKTREVRPGQNVYHRGKGNFAAYSTERDRRIKARTGHDPKKTGSGPYRQTGDKRRGESGTKKSRGNNTAPVKRPHNTVYKKAKPTTRKAKK